MIYKLSYSKLALKQLSKLPRGVKNRILATLERSANRPYSHVVRIQSTNYFRLRVGDYRVVVDIIDKEIRIHVIEVGHRKNIYKD